MKYFALASDGYMYDLCDCGDFEAAEESAADAIADGHSVVWIADQKTAEQWQQRLSAGLPHSRYINTRNF